MYPLSIFTQCSQDIVSTDSICESYSECIQWLYHPADAMKQLSAFWTYICYIINRELFPIGPCLIFIGMQRFQGSCDRRIGNALTVKSVETIRLFSFNAEGPQLCKTTNAAPSAQLKIISATGLFIRQLLLIRKPAGFYRV